MSYNYIFVLLALPGALLACSSNRSAAKPAPDRSLDAGQPDGSTEAASGGSTGAGGSSAAGSGGTTGTSGGAADAGPFDAGSADAGSDRADAGTGCDMDCSTLDGPCVTARCDPKTRRCQTTPWADGTSCDNRNPCTTATVCSGGQCGGGATVCALPAGITYGNTTADGTLVGQIGGSFSETCAPGTVLMGFSGTYTTSIDRADFHYLASATPICGSLALQWDAGSEAYDVPVTETDSLTSQGSSGSYSWKSVCPAGQVVTGLSGESYDVVLVSLRVACAPLAVAHGTGWAVTVGTPHDLGSPISTFGDTGYTGPCPEGEIAIGASGGVNGGTLAGLEVICAAPASD